MSRRANAGTALTRLLGARTPGVTISAVESTPWASVTFSGARHRLVASGEAAALDRFAAGLECDAFDLPGHIVAEIVVAGRAARSLTIEALTVEVD
jgi:hypothetical protein